MARWVLGCTKCKVDFTHSEILPNNSLPDPFVGFARKPEFPTGGLAIECPHCGKASTYQRHQLIYQLA
jgi:hypothetical protein